MKTARIALRKVIIGTLLAAALAFPKAAWAAAGAKITCYSGATCTVGEFLYDDSYAPIDSASCVINSLYPDASTFLNIGVSSPASVGWYSHSFTAPTTTGYYRTQICCTSGEDYLCLDKSFDVATAAATIASTDEIAEAVWGYSTRTMSGFGNLTADIWGYSSRTMSGFGNLISDLWGHSSRTLTGTQATNITSVTNNVASIEKTVTEIQTQLEQVVNKPVIQNYLENVPDLGAKINETKTTADMLFMNNQYVISQAGLLQLKWKTLSESELLENIAGLNSVLGEETDGSSTGSIFGQIAWLKNSWTWPLVEEVFDQTKAVKAALASVETKLGEEGKSTSAKKELKNLNYYLATLEKLIGDSTNLSGQKTLFGKLRETRELAEVFDSRETEVNELLANWKSNENKETQNKIDTLFKKVIAVNRISQASAAFSPKGGGSSLEKQLKNRLLGLRALITANRLLLAMGANTPFANTWLEEGSMVFKSLVTNPSKIISQKVTLKYYLPAEVKKENIIETDEGLTVSFDSEKSQYFVEGEFNLRPGETQTVAVKVADIWVISDDEVNGLRKQAEELSRPLKKTSYFAQGVTLKSDIDVSLDKILVLQEGKVTPEEKIRAYREAQIELNAAKAKMDKLKELVTQAGSAGNLLGFVGGSQTMAVWGLIIILLAGFVFLAIYMRIIMNNNHYQNSKTHEEENKTGEKEAGKSSSPLRIKAGQVIKMAAVFLVFGALTAVVSGIIVRKITLSSLPAEKQVFAQSDLSVETENQQTPEVEDLSVEEPKDEEKKEEWIKISVPSGGVINIRESPDLSSRILTQLTSSQEAEKLEITNEWVKVSLPDEDDPQEPLVGWVSDSFVSSE